MQKLQLRASIFCNFVNKQFNILIMTTLQIDVQDDVINVFGIRAVKKFIEQELAFQKFRLLEVEIQSCLKEASNVNWLTEFELARENAFNDYKCLYNRPL